MSAEFRQNHYVPVWYQKRFIAKQRLNRELFYLDLNPGTIRDPTGRLDTGDENGLRTLASRVRFGAFP
jgi:hypothetical protein